MRPPLPNTYAELDQMARDGLIKAGWEAEPVDESIVEVLQVLRAYIEADSRGALLNATAHGFSEEDAATERVAMELLYGNEMIRNVDDARAEAREIVRIALGKEQVSSGARDLWIKMLRSKP
jgi:hypothetical protein